MLLLYTTLLSVCMCGVSFFEMHRGDVDVDDDVFFFFFWDKCFNVYIMRVECLCMGVCMCVLVYRMCYNA